MTGPIEVHPEDRVEQLLFRFARAHQEYYVARVRGDSGAAHETQQQLLRREILAIVRELTGKEGA